MTAQAKTEKSPKPRKTYFSGRYRVPAVGYDPVLMYLYRLFYSTSPKAGSRFRAFHVSKLGNAFYWGCYSKHHYHCSRMLSFSGAG